MKSHTTAVVWVPPVDVWEPIHAVRRQWDSHLRRWPMPHVTLLYPFVPPTALRASVSALERAVASVPPFEATLAQFASFPHREPTMYLVPEPGDAFRKLHDAIRAAFTEMDDLDRFPGGFTPHMSVGQSPTARELDGLLASIAADFAPIRTRCDSVAVLQRSAETHDVMVETTRAPLRG